MKKWVAIILLFLPGVLHSQIIIKVAGNGSSVFSGNGIPAITAGIPNPACGAFDKYGNYYFADGIDNVIRKIDTTGIITTVVGTGIGAFGGDGGLADTAELYDPQGVILDSSGNLYIPDAGNNRIRKVDATTEIITTIAGTGVSGYSGDSGLATAAQIWNPGAVCFDKFGNLYISDFFNYCVRKVNTAGIITTFAGTGVEGYPVDGVPATAQDMDYPGGLASDDSGNIYIADPGSFSARVRKVNLVGIITTVAGNGSSTYNGDGIPATSAQIAPFEIALDKDNNLFISDRYNQRVYKVDTTGIIHNIAGNGIAGWSGDGGPATAAELDVPTGVVIDPCGNLYIPETGISSPTDTGRNIRKVILYLSCSDTTGTDTTTSVANIANNQSISIYPNPAHNTITITAGTSINNVAVVNLLGQTVYNQAYNSEQVQVNVAYLPAGIYYIKVNEQFVQKIIKE